jgi:hypothetical protein
VLTNQPHYILFSPLYSNNFAYLTVFCRSTEQIQLINQIEKLEEALKEKDAQYEEQLNETQHALGNLEYKLESLES